MARYYIPSSADESKTSWSYTPGSAIKDNNNGTYTTSNGLTFKNNYTTNTVTPAMSHAIKQAGGNPNDPKAADKYVENMLGRIGTLSANSGQVLTAADVQKELNRLGYKANGAGGDWMTVGSQQFLTGGDEYNKLKDTLNDIGRGNMNIYNGEMMPTQGNIYNYYAAQAGGGNVGYSSYMDAYAKALEQQLSRIDEQKRLAAENADKEKRQAYVAMKLGQKALNEQNAASGLQDSGYSEQSNIALTADYGNNLNTIDANYQQYLNDLAGTYADTALSGAGTLANLAQQDYANRIAAQQYADKMAQQQLENEWYEREWAAKQAQNEQNLAYEQAKTKADAAMDLGLWMPEIEQIYGINQQEYQAYLNEQSMAAARSAASYSSSRGRSAGGGSSGGGGGIIIDENDDGGGGGNGGGVGNKPPKPGKAPQVQETAARNSYANDIKDLQNIYGLRASDASIVRDIMAASGATVDEALEIMRQMRTNTDVDTVEDVARRYNTTTTQAARMLETAKQSGITVNELMSTRFFK